MKLKFQVACCVAALINYTAKAFQPDRLRSDFPCAESAGVLTLFLVGATHLVGMAAIEVAAEFRARVGRAAKAVAVNDAVIQHNGCVVGSKRTADGTVAEINIEVGRAGCNLGIGLVGHWGVNGITGIVKCTAGRHVVG